jgi:HSP20 family molecular chaperone IbpA
MKARAARPQKVRVARLQSRAEAAGERFGHALAEMIDEEDRIEILAAVPDFDASHLVVDVLPGEIDVEGDAETKRTLLSRFALPCAVNPRATTARLNRGRLIVKAPKAKLPVRDS